MKKTIALLLLISSSILSAQDIPSIYVSTLKVIEGSYLPLSKINVSGNIDLSGAITITADKNGYFKENFSTPYGSAVTVLYIQATNGEGKNPTSIIAVKVQTAESALNLIVNDETNPYKTARKKGNREEYKATILNTNFSIPVARFNLVKEHQIKEGEEVTGAKDGDITLFSSIGAGFGISWGRITEVKDIDGEILTQTFQNTIGTHLGVLYSAGGEDNRNVASLMLAVSVLDFQIGVGHELGTVAEGQRKTFFTFNYSIPLYKLTNTGFWIMSTKKKGASKKTKEEPKFSKNTN